MNLLLAPLRPLADVLDLTAEAVAALSETLQRESEEPRRPQLTLLDGRVVG